MAAWWLEEAHLLEGLGCFKEIASPAFHRFETLFSTPDTLQGAGCALGRISASDIQEHGYWGSLRDRLPASQTDQFPASGSARIEALDASGKRIRVIGHNNVAMIRSGQDWATTSDKERELYVMRMEPMLREGMDFLERSGESIGCYTVATWM